MKIKSNRWNKIIVTVVNCLVYIITVCITVWQFGLIVFNDDVKTLKECYENQLVPVTSATTKSFRDFLTSQVGEGGTDFTAALRKAFMFFKANMSAEKNNRG